MSSRACKSKGPPSRRRGALRFPRSRRAVLRGRLRFCGLVAILLLGAALGFADPYSVAAKALTAEWKDGVYLWLPAVSANPNEGWTYGFMPAAVLTDPATRRIRHIIAPSYLYNRLYGPGGALYYFFYPAKTSQLAVAGILGAHTYREATVHYENLAFLGGRFNVLAEGSSLRTASQRFYGIGPTAPSRGATGYVSEGARALGFLGVNLARSWRFALGAGFRREVIGPNIVPGVGDIGAQFPGLPGLRTQNTVTQTALLTRDTRDLPATPSRGSLARFFAAKTTRAWGSDADYFRYGFEAKKYAPWPGRPRQTTVVHALYDWGNGRRIPFYDLAGLGGRETLRGYGSGRFFDRGRVALNLEQRAALSERDIMGVRLELQAAPFVDVGTVFPRATAMRGKDLRPVFGAAFRVVAKPSVAASIDVGVGNEGPALFVGLDYPF